MSTAKIIASASVMLFCAAFMMACGSSTPPPEPEAVATPHFVNDLSALSPQTVNHLDNPHAASAAIESGPNAIGHAFEDQPGMQRHVGTERMPAVEQLMNPKAAQFANFSGGLLDKLWGQLRLREEDDAIARLKLPTELQPVILTATLSPDGKLQEIVVEQHSGKAAIDKLIVEACKKALWWPNPPKAASLPNGTYQVQVQATLENYASVTENHWTFTTYMGIKIL
ncbi:MAG: energy transducer TonB [Candidatus Binataceae bacterium]